MNDTKEISKVVKIVLAVMLAVLLAFLAVQIYKVSKSNYLDKQEYNKLVQTLETGFEDISSSDELISYLREYLDKNSYSYEIDSSNNIIFSVDSAEGKSDIEPTVICANYNIDDLSDSVMPIASALTIAGSGIKSEKYNVIIFNNNDDYGEGYKTIADKYFPDNSDVVLLDYGDEAYISGSSFAQTNNCLQIPLSKTTNTHDTAVKVSISGIDTSCIGDKSVSQPNPSNYLSNILTKLNSKSISYQLADIQVDSVGNMYPRGMSFVILLDSYTLETLTTYLDGRIEKFDKTYKGDFEDAEFTYEIIENSEDFPEQVYSESVTNSLNTALYTVKNGSYLFTEDDVPDTANVGDIYARNCITNIKENGNYLELDIISSAMSKPYMKQILEENASAAELSGASFTTKSRVDAFKNSSEDFSNDMVIAYFKSNHSWSSPQDIPVRDDSFFTACSYIQGINENMNIMHLRSSKALMAKYTNTLLYYIDVKGNFLSL